MPTARRTNLAIRSFRQRHDRPPVAALAPADSPSPLFLTASARCHRQSPNRGIVRVKPRQHFAERRWLDQLERHCRAILRFHELTARSFISAMRGATRYDLNSMAAEPRRFTRERSGVHHFELSAGQILKRQRPKHARRGKSRLVRLPQNRLSPFLSGPGVSPWAPANLAMGEGVFSGGQEGGG
jgi:hypothetical protein